MIPKLIKDRLSLLRRPVLGYSINVYYLLLSLEELEYFFVGEHHF